jgi:hypothetical protein
MGATPCHTLSFYDRNGHQDSHQESPRFSVMLQSRRTHQAISSCRTAVPLFPVSKSLKFPIQFDTTMGSGPEIELSRTCNTH